MGEFFENPANWMPYFVSIITAVVSGIASYTKARRETKHDLEKMEKQHSIDIDNEREKHKLDMEREAEKHRMEIEKLKLMHQHELEMRDKESQNEMGKELMSVVVGKAMEMPAIQEQLNDSFKKSGNRQQRRARK